MDKVISLFKGEFLGWEKSELILFFVSLVVVSCSAILKGDEIIAVIASVFGIIYTFSAGKGKIYCYFFGIISTFLCGIIALKSAIYGTFALYFLYYLPMEVWGIFSWKKHLKDNTNEIIKTKLSQKERIWFMIISASLVIIAYLLFDYWHDLNPLADSLVVVLSVGAMYLTVKRCIEQWGLWTIVNILSIWLWFEVFLSGEKTFSVFVIRIIYFFLGIYFYFKWRKSVEE
ncbi:nicotinamide mononucleotide transporter [bacterium]|nr:nicotinamide mononucleotide transporter [bacterium]